MSGEPGDQPEASRKARATSEAMVRTMGVKIHAMRPPLPMIAGMEVLFGGVVVLVSGGMYCKSAD